MPSKKTVQIAKPPITWILVADGRQAQVYTRQKIEKLIPVTGNSKRNQFTEVISREPVPVPGMKWEAESAEQYQVEKNATGMVFESASSARHMAEPRTNVHEEIKDHFAKTIAEQLNRAKAQKAFDRLVLIAPAKMLGEIKKQLDESVLQKLVMEMSKDLTHYNAEELASHLERIA